MERSPRNCQELSVSEIFTTLVRCYRYMDAVKRHKIPGSAAKDFITQSNTSDHSTNISLHQFPVPQFPHDNIKRVR